MSLITQANTTQRLLVELSDKHRAILGAMVWGLNGKMAEKHGKEPGKALTQFGAAEVFHVRRAYIRDLIADPLFRLELTNQLAHKRLGYAPEAVDRIATAMRNDDDSIGLRAAVAMLGETTGSAAANVSVTVNNQTNVATAIRPGYVVRLPADLISSPSPQTPASDAISAGEAQHNPQP